MVKMLCFQCEGCGFDPSLGLRSQMLCSVANKILKRPGTYPPLGSRAEGLKHQMTAVKAGEGASDYTYSFSLPCPVFLLGKLNIHKEDPSDLYCLFS